MICPLCDEELHSSVGLGCKMRGMPLKGKKKFCLDICRKKYRKINK